MVMNMIHSRSPRRLRPPFTPDGIVSSKNLGMRCVPPQAPRQSSYTKSGRGVPSSCRHPFPCTGLNAANARNASATHYRALLSSRTCIDALVCCQPECSGFTLCPWLARLRSNIYGVYRVYSDELGKCFPRHGCVVLSHRPRL